MLTYNRLKHLSFTHSAIYAGLLAVWLIPGLETAEFILGMSHGLGWFAMCALAVIAMRKRIIPFWLAVTVAVVGGIGPFAGSIGFVVNDRRRDPRATQTIV